MKKYKQTKDLLDDHLNLRLYPELDGVQYSGIFSPLDEAIYFQLYFQICPIISIIRADILDGE